MLLYVFSFVTLKNGALKSSTKKRRSSVSLFFWKLKMSKYEVLISGVLFIPDQKGRWRKALKNYYLYAENKNHYIYVRFKMNQVCLKVLRNITAEVHMQVQICFEIKSHFLGCLGGSLTQEYTYYSPSTCMLKMEIQIKKKENPTILQQLHTCNTYCLSAVWA